MTPVTVTGVIQSAKTEIIVAGLEPGRRSTARGTPEVTGGT
jgi:hypothetical protein